MKHYYYEVGAFMFSDTVAFGEAWKDAKNMAMELHIPIYREIVQNGVIIRYEVYLNGGVFVSTDCADTDSIKIF